jgi:predicted aspartyl protease
MDGLIDHLGRPILRVEMPEPGTEGFLCQIDTGFNRYLLFERSVAHAIGFRQQNSTVIDQIVLGDGSIKSAWLARGTIIWFGAPMVVDAHIVPDAKRRAIHLPSTELTR